VEAAVRDARLEAAAGVAEPSAVREAVRWAVAVERDAAPRQAAVRAVRPSPAAASALPSAAASACRRDRALPFAPAPRRWARPRRAMRSLQIASPLAQSWQAAGDEVWSCDGGSPESTEAKSAAINKYALGRNVAAQAGGPGYIFAKNKPSLEPRSWRIQPFVSNRTSRVPCDRRTRLVAFQRHRRDSSQA